MGSAHLCGFFKEGPRSPELEGSSRKRKRLCFLSCLCFLKGRNLKLKETET